MLEAVKKATRCFVSVLTFLVLSFIVFFTVFRLADPGRPVAARKAHPHFNQAVYDENVDAWRDQEK